jgi:hypothetical protein
MFGYFTPECRVIGLTIQPQRLCAQIVFGVHGSIIATAIPSVYRAPSAEFGCSDERFAMKTGILVVGVAVLAISCGAVAEAQQRKAPSRQQPAATAQPQDAPPPERSARRSAGGTGAYGLGTWRGRRRPHPDGARAAPAFRAEKGRNVRSSSR